MVSVVKSEWHQIERRFGLEFNQVLLEEIYPDLDQDEIVDKLAGLESGEVDPEEVIMAANEQDISLDWDWLDEDDLWTDRKGGYEVTYNVDQDRVAPNHQLASMTLAGLSDEQEREFTVRISGQGGDHGVGKINKAQYEYWSERPDDLADALNDSYDYEANGTPNKAVLNHLYYNEYTDMGFWTGPDLESSFLNVVDSDNKEIISGELFECLDKIHGNEAAMDAVGETDDFYIGRTHLKPGYYISWEQYGDGFHFEGTVVTNNFDPALLTFETLDLSGTSIIHRVLYDGEEVENWGGSWSGTWSDYQVHKIEK